MKTIDLPRCGLTAAYDEAGTGLPVVLLHGFPFDRGMWEPQLAPLAAAGFRVLAPDFPGMGRTAAGTEPFAIDGAGDFVAAVLDALGVARAVVGGLSMGGYAAMAFARRHPARLAGLILADTKAAPDDEAGRATRDRLIATAKAEGPGAIADEMLPKLMGEKARKTNPAAVRLAETVARRQTVDGIVGALAALRDRPDAAPGLPKVAVPTLVLVGEYDEVTPPLAAARLGALVAGSEVVHIPGAGHLSNVENPDAFNAAVVGWLKQLKP